MSPPRPSWDDYFLEITGIVAKRSTCLRRQVGCLIVKDKRILATGYNGAPAGLPHCEEVGCLREKLGIPPGERHELCRGIHAEQNAIIQAATFGVSIKGAMLYTTHHPCILCTKMIINAGIQRVVSTEGYPDELAAEMLKEAHTESVVVGPCVTRGKTATMRMVEEGQITPDGAREIVFSTNEDARNEFSARFEHDIDAFVHAFSHVYNRFVEVQNKVPKDKRSAWVQMFLFSAANSVLTSFHLLISGLTIPAGNQMRQFAEAVAMALLCSHRGIDTFRRLEKDPGKFPIQDAVSLVARRRNSSLLCIEKNGWEDFCKKVSFYHMYSHPSALACANLLSFDSLGKLGILGSGFDPGKLEAYRKEIQSHATACELLHHVVEHAEHNLLTSREDRGSRESSM